MFTGHIDVKLQSLFRQVEAVGQSGWSPGMEGKAGSLREQRVQSWVAQALYSEKKCQRSGGTTESRDGRVVKGTTRSPCQHQGTHRPAAWRAACRGLWPVHLF